MGSVAAKVLPSPVCISAMEWWNMAMPPRSCTSKCRMLKLPPAGLADQGVGLDQQLRKRLAVLGPIAERQAGLAKLLVVEFD